MTQADKAVTLVLSLIETFNYDFSEADIEALEAESTGWVCLSKGAHLHEGSVGSNVIQFVGIAHSSMSESNTIC